MIGLLALWPYLAYCEETLVFNLSIMPVFIFRHLLLDRCYQAWWSSFIFSWEGGSFLYSKKNSAKRNYFDKGTAFNVKPYKLSNIVQMLLAPNVVGSQCIDWLKMQWRNTWSTFSATDAWNLIWEQTQIHFAPLSDLASMGTFLSEVDA